MVFWADDSWPMNWFPRGIYEQQVEIGLHPSFSVTVLPSGVSSTAIHCALMLLLVVYFITHTHILYPCEDSRYHAVSACDIASSNYGRGM